MNHPETLPVDAIAHEFMAALARGPVVLTAPTGTGKSTQVPRWCARAGSRVLVVEPRRVACRGLASRVAELETTRLGQRVGYAVRDDTCLQPDSAMVFATPGVVLRWLAANALAGFDTVILDEFHERSVDTDLLLALLMERFPGQLVVMSATLDGPRVADHIGGLHLAAEGRRYPVAIRYRPDGAFLPDVRGLEERVVAAVAAVAGDPGDILVFLPGKGEIARCQEVLARGKGLDVLPMHGGLTLLEQARVFQPASRRRVILATNVAETSITVPGIGVVIDSGLVRRTRYHNGRGFLTLAPIAGDSADQRSGRAGRTAPGVAIRLWSKEALLTERTPPEIHREALVDLVMGASACHADVTTLPFLDPPRPYAVEAARAVLERLGALSSDLRITPRGQQLFHLPLDPPLAALLVAAQESDCLPDMIDLVAALAVGRPLFNQQRPDEEEADLRRHGCDVVAAILAVRLGDAATHGLNAAVLTEARQNRRRLRELMNCSQPPSRSHHVDRRPLAMATLKADNTAAHVARVRKRSTAWSNGGTEIALSRESALPADRKDPILVLESRALGVGARKGTILVTCAMPIPPQWLLDAHVGEDEVIAASLEGGIATATVGQVYAGTTLGKTEVVPTGELARKTVAQLFLAHRLWRKQRVCHRAAEALDAHRLLLRLARSQLVDLPYFELADMPYSSAVPALEDFVHQRLLDVGLESGGDLPLLTPDDLLPPPLPDPVLSWLDRRYPRLLDLGDARYEVRYDLARQAVTLDKREGQRKEPPSVTLLPAWRGFSILAKHGSKGWQLR